MVDGCRRDCTVRHDDGLQGKCPTPCEWMKEMKQWLMVAAVIALCGMMTGCKGNAQRPVNGTMEEAVAPGDAPQAVTDLMKQVNIDDRYEIERGLWYRRRQG